MEDEVNGIGPEWKTTSMEDDLNGRQHQGKRISGEERLYGTRPHCKVISMEDNLNGRRHIGKNTSIEEYLNGSQPQWKPYRKLMTLVCLAR